MSIDKLKAGNLLKFNYGPPASWRGDPSFDLGIIVEVCAGGGPPMVLVYWEDDHDKIYHDEELVNNWMAEGKMEVVSESR